MQPLFLKLRAAALAALLCSALVCLASGLPDRAAMADTGAQDDLVFVLDDLDDDRMPAMAVGVVAVRARGTHYSGAFGSAPTHALPAGRWGLLCNRATGPPVRHATL